MAIFNFGSVYRKIFKIKFFQKSNVIVYVVTKFPDNWLCLYNTPYDKTIWPLIPGRVAQSVTCLATDACLTANPGVVSLILVWSHTFVEIVHEMISTGILPSADSFKKGCCQLQAKVCARITG